ncbi:MAG: hypothetical protein ABI333_28075, partial [bacterium]
ADVMGLRRIFDLVDSALGRSCLPSWIRTGERLQSKDPADASLRRLMVRLCARLGDGVQAANHRAVLEFLDGTSSVAEVERDPQRSGVNAKVVTPFGQAIPDAANVPLRSVLARLHPQLGCLAPPIDPSVLGAEIDPGQAGELAATIESVKELLAPGPVGAVFARRPRQPVTLIFSLPPVLLVDPQLADWPLGPVRFVLARALELARSGSLLLLVEPAGRVQQVLDTVAQLFEIPQPPSARPDPELAHRFAERGFSADRFDNDAMEALQVAFFNYYRDPTDIGTYREAALHTANRIGLLVTGELAPALNGLAAQLHGEYGGDVRGTTLEQPVRNALVDREPQLAELMRFGTSSLFPSLLRRRVTLTRR